MALNQTNKLVWIVETIYRAHKISFEELNRRWMDNVESNCSMIENIPPKGVSFSDFICTFAMSFRVLFAFYLQH